MEETFIKAEQMAGHIREYVENRIESVKLGVAEKSSAVLSNIIAMLVVISFLALAGLFLSIALALFIARLTGELYWGFLFVSGIYLVTGSLIWMMREKLLRFPIMNSILRQLYKEDEEGSYEKN